MHHAVAEKRCIDLSSYHYPSFFVYYLFDSPALFYEVKNWKGLSSAISGWATLGTEGGGVRFLHWRTCIWLCVDVFKWNDSYTLCVLSALYLKKKKGRRRRSAIVCFLSTSCPNTLKITTDGCVSSERWFKPHISTERSHSGERRGSKWLFILPWLIPRVWWRKVYPRVGHQVGVCHGAATSRDATVNHANWWAALQCLQFKWRLFNHYRL